MKNLSRPQYSRIKRILELVRTGKYPNATDFCREIQVTRRTILRDLDFLRYEETAPIEYDQSRKGYFLSDKTWNLAPVELSTKEIFAFSIARKLMEGFRGTPLEMDMQSVLRKMEESMEGKITVEPGTLTEHFTVLGEDYVKLDAAIWSAVAKAVDKREEIKILYEKFNGEVKEQVLEPYHMVAYHGNWYLLAGKTHGTNTMISHPSSENSGRRETADDMNPHANRPEKNVKEEEGERPTSNAQHPTSKLDNQIKTYALSRIRKLEETGRIFDVPHGFDPKEHMKQAFGIMAGNKPFAVKLRFSKNVAAYIKERVWHPSQKVKERRDGTVDLSFETGGWKELVRWILSWQPDVQVLKPVELRQRVREKMMCGLRAFNRRTG